MIITRFAPSPTGILHIGNVRTALFNYLFTRNLGGKCLLRIEDTDKARSTPEAIEAIHEGLKWLGLLHDGDPVLQSKNMERHQQVARELLEKGLAYESFETGEGEKTDRPAIRLKSDKDKPGEAVFHDLILGTMTIKNEQLDDLVLLRSDGTPTYLLAVVVDDHDMGITHVIRGNDHLLNTFRQQQIFKAMGWETPKYGHLPIIESPQGGKLSKRDGAVGVAEYRDMGILPEALFNYLLLLGWSYGDREFFTKEEAIKEFSIHHVHKNPAKLDTDKLLYFNAHYLRQMGEGDLLEKSLPFFEKSLSALENERILKLMPELKERAKTLRDIVEGAGVLLDEVTIDPEDKAKEILKNIQKPELDSLLQLLKDQTEWNHTVLFEAVKAFASQNGQKVGAVAGILRAKITGQAQGPSIFKIMEILGKEETIQRFSRP